ncbi:GGDEF domain-containing protein [Sphingomonas crocodyli]|uniref:diguanylate cyclase n=1 Tax=Sphingomonas crocodyli TaxID=1979270 RepID=A0A437M4H5_9SPHN|nr:GGDEF domain-containing protein [Sphingomonas crocodyli]RVT92620.1 GGDEF domain-containing protein [Sphingomonas crocodyli]
MHQDKIIESSAQRGEWRRLYDRIGELLFSNDIEPTPENFELCHRYLSGDSTIVGLIDKAVRKDGRITAAAMTAINAQVRSGLDSGNLSDMAESARGLLEQVSAVVTRSGDEARDYAADLESGAAGLSVEDPGMTVDTLVGLTKAMIDKTRAAEDELRRTEAQIKSLHDDLAAAHRTANSDPLTGLPNRRAFDHQLRIALENARRQKTPLALAICDIDHFKQFNDTHGHQIGDEVIKFVGSSLARATNDGFCARYGGEEFVLIFERADPEAARAMLDKVRTVIASRELKVTNTGQSLGRLSFSGGIAMLEDADSPGTLLRRADTALYRAKESGRNRVMLDA